MTRRTLATYEQEIHRHRGQRTAGARHNKCAPFACNGALTLNFEPRARSSDRTLVVERCQGCAKIVTVYQVLPETQPANNDDQDDCA